MARSQAKKSPRRAARRSSKRVQKSRSPKTAPSLAGVPIELIAAELKRRQAEIPALERRARDLRAELLAVESRIAMLQGSASVSAPASAPRARRAGPAPKTVAKGKRAAQRRNGKPTLAERIVELLGTVRGPLSPREIASRIAPALGREMSQSFLVQISLTLRKLVNSGAIAQPARAQYAVSGRAGASGGAEAKSDGGNSDSRGG